ncbi:hypothetical protein O6H91_09G062400 [Diphasiastrum complanatum]|nr:hypothetical protein O6H91_09G062400 [Diphasiastrum complanatum]
MSVKNAIVGKTEQTDANRKEEEDAIAEKLRKGGQQVGDKAGEAADDVQSKGLLKAAGEQLMQTSEVVGNQIIGSAQAAKESFMGTADRKQDHSVPVRQRAAEEVGAAKDTVVQTGDEKKEQAKGILQAVQETLMGKADQKQGHAVPDRQGAAEKGNAAKNTVMQTVEEKKEQGKGFMQSVADTLSPKQTETDRKIDRNAAADSGKHVGKGMV